MTSYGYSRVPGSDQLKTAPHGGDDEVAALEALDPSATAGRWVHGEWLCRTVVRGGGVSVLEDVFDRLLPLHEAEEAAVYVQLYRLSYGEERNWCRTSRKVLRARSNLSDRRLGGALSGLVEKDHIRLLHRDRRGTLYRVRLPHEIFDEPDRDLVFSARPSAVTGAPANDLTPARSSSEPDQGPTALRKERKKTAARPRRERQADAHLPGGASDNNSLSKSHPNEPSAAATNKAGPKRLTVGGVASAFMDRFGGRTSSKQEAVEAVFSRLEQNVPLAEVAEELTRFGEQAPAHLQVADLSRWLASG